MPRLIVNADDLGLTSGVNRAILRAHHHGIVSSATLMANAPALDEAVATILALPAYKNRTLGIGCHVVLIDGAPSSPPELIPSLLRSQLNRPQFRKKLWQFALAAALGAIRSEEVAIEAKAQIEKLQQAGIAVSHLDCHKHTHMFPAVLEGVLRAAKETGIKAVRNPFEPPFARKIPGASRTRASETALLRRLWSKHFALAVAQRGLATTNGSLGVTATGTLDIQSFVATLRNLPAEGIYEFVCHPGYNDADLAAAGTRLLQSRETELQLLCAPEARDAIHSSHAKLTNFWELASASESNPAVAHPTP